MILSLVVERDAGSGSRVSGCQRGTIVIESLNSIVRRAVRVLGHFPNDRSAVKLIHGGWKRPLQLWQQARTEIEIRLGESFVVVAWPGVAVPHRLPTGVLPIAGIALVGGPWKSIRAPVGRGTTIGVGELGSARLARTATLARFGR